jgi:hypothetical protein
VPLVGFAISGQFVFSGWTRTACISGL